MSTPKQCLVIDIEATCWEHLTPPYPKSDIIEIGITSIAMPDKEVLDSRSIIVIPTNSEISEFCTELTTLTPEYVAKNGIPFEDAIRILRNEYKVHRNMWASWGDFDKNNFCDQCKKETIRYPFNNIHLNVKALFAWRYGFNCSVSKAATYMGMQFEGTKHRGIWDSLMIAKMLMDL